MRSIQIYIILLISFFLFAGCKAFQASPKLLLTSEQSSEQEESENNDPENPPADVFYNFVIEVFDTQVAQDKRLVQSKVTVVSSTGEEESKTTDGNGFTHFYKKQGAYTIKIERDGFELYQGQYTLNREHSDTFPGTEKPSLRVALKRPPPKFYNLAIEVFEGSLTKNKRVPSAKVKVDDDERVVDGNGFVHFWVQEGVRAISVTAQHFKKYSLSYNVNREHVETYPSNNQPTLRIELESDRACTTSVVNDDNLNLPKKLPNLLSVVEEVNKKNPGLINESCVEEGGNNEFLFAVVAELRKHDPRFGLNWKRANKGDMSQDVVDYYRGQGPFENGHDTYVIDVIAGHCGPNPQPAWIDVTCYGADCPAITARWTIDPIPKCNP